MPLSVHDDGNDSGKDEIENEIERELQEELDRLVCKLYIFDTKGPDLS